ncbi:MAG: hypothetical protein LH609_07630 [Rudanella sp.]|nr:hypothetical protein [Rudanella sp.]
MKLPNCEQAIIPDMKLHGYLLNEENSKGKSAFFYKMGFEKEQFGLLKNPLAQLACTGELIGTIPGNFGEKYKVVGQLNNPAGRNALVLSIWMFDPGSDIPRFITAYPF